MGPCRLPTARVAVACFIFWSRSCPKRLAATGKATRLIHAVQNADKSPASTNTTRKTIRGRPTFLRDWNDFYFFRTQHIAADAAMLMSVMSTTNPTA